MWHSSIYCVLSYSSFVGAVWRSNITGTQWTSLQHSSYPLACFIGDAGLATATLLQQLRCMRSAPPILQPAPLGMQDSLQRLCCTSFATATSLQCSSNPSAFSIGDAGIATATYSFVCRASACSIEDAALQRAAESELPTSLLQFRFACRASACSVEDAALQRAAD